MNATAWSPAVSFVSSFVIADAIASETYPQRCARRVANARRRARLRSAVPADLQPNNMISTAREVLDA